MLEMLNAGLLQAMVVDDWKAKLWAQVLPKLKVHDDLVLRDADEDGLGDPQGQPEARAPCWTTSITTWAKKAGRDPVPPAAVHEDASRR